MQENAEQKSGKTDTAKFKKPLKFDFSFTNWGEATERWLKGVKKRYSTLFPDVSKQARILAGIKVKATEADSESSSSESGSDSSGRDLDSEYEGHGNGRDNDHQNDADGNIDADIHQGSGDYIDCKKEGDSGGYQQTDNEADNEQEGDDNEDSEGLEYASEELDEENGPRVHGSGNEGDNGNHGDDDGDGGLDNAGNGNEVQVAEEDDYEMLELETHQPLALSCESALSDISD
jgi:hypothetical protein